MYYTFCLRGWGVVISGIDYYFIKRTSNFATKSCFRGKSWHLIDRRLTLNRWPHWTELFDGTKRKIWIIAENSFAFSARKCWRWELFCVNLRPDRVPSQPWRRAKTIIRKEERQCMEFIAPDSHSIFLRRSIAVQDFSVRLTLSRCPNLSKGLT